MATNNDKKKNNNYQKKNNYNYKKKNTSLTNNKNPELKKKDLTQKEINKKKYENRQKYYREKRKNINNQQNKPNAVIEENKQIIKPVENKIDNRNIKKEVKVKSDKKKKAPKKESTFKKNIREFKTIGVDAYNNVLEKTSDKDIPLGKSKEEKKIRKKRYAKEAFVFAIIITFIYLILYIIFDDINLLRVFDIKVFNVIITIIVLLLIGYLFSYIVDYLVSELWVIIRRKRLGKKNGNNRTIEEEHQSNIENQERE